MPKVTINDRTVEVPKGTNLIEAAGKVGVQIPHYCYHPRLSVVGQCRMCLVEITAGGRKMPKLQAACSSQVNDDSWEVRTDSAEVHEAQKGMMEFFLINHPLDCPICDQAGECGLQDYSFKHGVAFSRFRFEDKRTYPGRERIPLGPTVVLNMNRCIQCTRCVRFTHEIAGTGELGFFERGARAEIGTFPGKELNNDLATCVVDICPVGALTSTRFRFAERVWYLDKKPSVCTGCDVGCNVTVEHRRGEIKRLKPRFNPEVNDYWMCDAGRATHERWKQLPRLLAPRLKGQATSWKDALDFVYRKLHGKGDAAAILGSGFLTTEEAWLLGKLAALVGTTNKVVSVDSGTPHTIPRFERPAIQGNEAAPNRRGVELAGFASGEAPDAEVLVVADSDFGAVAHDPKAVERLRRAEVLIVFGWADTPLAQAADVALPVATAAEREGTFVNVERRLQKLERAFPSPGQVRPLVEALGDLLERFESGWASQSTAAVFDRMAAELPALTGLSWRGIPATGSPLEVSR